MYVCTVSIVDLNWMVRIECFHTLAGPFATYTRTDEHGEQEAYSCPIGPDNANVGLPTVAVLDLVRDLDWSEAMGALQVVHAGAIDHAAMRSILLRAAPAYQARALTTTTSTH